MGYGMVTLYELKRMQRERINQAIQYNDIDWNRFLMRFREPHIKVLEVVYLPQPQTVIYKHVYQSFRAINYSERSARRIIADLGQSGLLIHFTSTFGVIKPVLELTNNIQSLIQLYRSKGRAINEVEKEHYDEIATLILEDKWQETEGVQKSN